MANLIANVAEEFRRNVLPIFGSADAHAEALARQLVYCGAFDALRLLVKLHAPDAPAAPGEPGGVLLAELRGARAELARRMPASTAARLDAVGFDAELFLVNAYMFGAFAALAYLDTPDTATARQRAEAMTCELEDEITIERALAAGRVH